MGTDVSSMAAHVRDNHKSCLYTMLSIYYCVDRMVLTCYLSGLGVKHWNQFIILGLNSFSDEPDFEHFFFFFI